MGSSDGLCIFCGVNPADSLEHIFPESIGGSLKSYLVCQTCNHTVCSSADAALIDHYFIQQERFLHGIQGKKGHLPNPYREGQYIDVPEVRVRSRPNSAGILQPEFVTTLKVIEGGFSVHGSRPDEVVKAVNTRRRRLGMKEIPAEKLLASATIEKVQPGVRFQHEIDLVEYKRGIAKICYELGCLWLGRAYASDPIGKKLRTLAMAPVLADIIDDVGVTGSVSWSKDSPDLADFFRLVGVREEEPHHVAILAHRRRMVFLMIRIFNSFSGHVLMTRLLRRYPDYYPRLLVIDPISRTIREED